MINKNLKKFNSAALAFLLMGSAIEIPMQAYAIETSSLDMKGTYVDTSNGGANTSFINSSAKNISLNQFCNISLPSHTALDENGKTIYPKGLIGVCAKFTTTSKDSFYKFDYVNATCNSNVTFTIYKENKIPYNTTSGSGGIEVINVGQTSSPIIKLDKNTTYYIVASVSNAQVLGNSNEISFKISEIVDDVSDIKETSKTIEFNKNYLQTMDGHKDEDWFTFTTKNEKSFYNFYFLNKSIINSLNYTIYNSKMEVVKTIDLAEGKSYNATFSLDENETYYIKTIVKTGDKANSSKILGNYELLVSQLEDDYADSMMDAKKIEMKKSYNGTIQFASDIDRFQFNSENCNEFYLELKNNSTSNKLNYKVTDSNDKAITTGTINAMSNSKISLPRKSYSKNGTYYVVLSGPENTNYDVEVGPITHDIVYNLNGGTNADINPSTFNETTITYFANPTRVGYNFIGWYTTAFFDESTRVTNVGEKETDTFTIYAKWNPISYKINYNLNGGVNNDANPSTYIIEDKVNYKNPSRLGYDFLGWYTSPNFDESTKVTGINKGSINAVTIYAKWAPTNYSISYQLNKGKNNKNNPTTYTIEQSKSIAKPTRKGYVFKGWYTNSKFKSNSKISSISVGTVGNKTLYAKWEKCNPKKPSIKSTTPKSNKIGVKIKKVSRVNGYQVQYSTSSKMKKAKTLNTKSTSPTISKLKKGKTYYVRVRSYVVDSTNKKITSKWSKVEKVTLK